jgi:hypothetical protein
MTASIQLLWRLRAIPCDRDFFTGRTGGREGETEARAWARAAARELATPSLLLNLRGNIFRFGPPNRKMRSRLPHASRPPVLPSSLLILEGVSPRAVRTTAARGVPFGETEGRHGSFCKKAAAGQPQDELTWERSWQVGVATPGRRDAPSQGGSGRFNLTG